MTQKELKNIKLLRKKYKVVIISIKIMVIVVIKQVPADNIGALPPAPYNRKHANRLKKKFNLLKKTWSKILVI